MDGLIQKCSRAIEFSEVGLVNMAANVFVFVGCGLMAWLLFRFKLVKTTTRKDVRKLIPAFLVFAVFFAFNALLAYLGRSGLAMVIRMGAVTSTAVLEDKNTGDVVILGGVVSAQNEVADSDYVAYVDDQRLWSPRELWFDLEDGAIAVTNDAYSRRNWPIDDLEFEYLEVGQPVIVLGVLERAVLLGGDRKQKEFSIRAEMIFAGEHDAFVARAKRNIVLPTGMLGANILGFALVILIPLLFWVRRPDAAPGDPAAGS